jgi:GNAT superfamily N-acetyltransferase
MPSQDRDQYTPQVGSGASLPAGGWRPSPEGPPFIVFSMPRSRSTWLSRYLSYGEWGCGHEELLNLRSLDDAKAWLGQPCTGTVETAAAPFWRLLLRYRPDTRVVVVRRPVDEVVASYMALPLGFEVESLTRLVRRVDAKLGQIEQRVPDVVSVTFADLATEDGCRRVFEHCLPYPHDATWWASARNVNVQMDMRQCVRKFRAYQPQLEKLAKMAKQTTLAGMAREAEIDGVTFQQEPFEQWYRDGQALFAEHLMRVGEAPDNHAFKNLPLLRTLDAVGALQITTARSNGRMFGYLATLVGPSLESHDGVWATNTFFYASPDIRGLGMKLQRASIEALRERGVDEVFMLAGPRGDGPRMGGLYRRLGAEDSGQFFRLRLEA